MDETTKKIKCTCDHGDQDKMFGNGIRLHNYAPTGYANNPGWRCTVCTHVKPAK